MADDNAKFDLESPDRVFSVDSCGDQVTLPVSKEQLNDFVKSLLGRPQSVSRRVEGMFSVTRDDIFNLHQLLNQRIEQQNDGQLMQLSCQIHFSDGSTVALGSIEELMTYDETRNLVSDAIHLTWDFLVRFKGKEFPERQQVQLSILAGAKNPVVEPDSSGAHREDEVYSYFLYTINHTARTWAVDIDGLMSNFIGHIVTPEGKMRATIRRQARLLGLFCAIAFLIPFLTGWSKAESDYHRTRKNALLSEYVAEGADAESLQSISRRIDFLIAEQLDPRGEVSENHLFIVMSTIMGVNLIAFAIMFSVKWAARLRRPSFLLLTRAAENAKSSSLKSRNRKLMVLTGSAVLGIVTSVSANWIYDTLMSLAE